VIERAALVGTWRLRTWTSTFADGGVGEPFGQAPEGVLVYTDGGTMITTIGRAARPPITGGDLLSGPDDEILAMARSFIAYSGGWSIDGDDVLHAVAMSLFPDWVGGVQRRHVALLDDGATLVLTTDAMVLRGRTGVQRLEWERVAA
jgi:hypothetical protein